MKHPSDFRQINLLGAAEQSLRLAGIYDAMRSSGIEAALVHSNSNIYYLTGRVFRGYIYIDSRSQAPVYLVRQPSVLQSHSGETLFHIRKPEEIKLKLEEGGIKVPSSVAFELSALSYTDAMRLAKAVGMEYPDKDISGVLRAARAVKTPAELHLLEMSGEKQKLVYERIPRLYQPGMTDLELQIEIERASRLEGCLGLFRIGGQDMELFMGNVLTGENADTPSPYDFAMGGAGADPSLPVGANGTVIAPGCPVMVDVNGNYTGYMTDMTRCYYVDSLKPEVLAANALSSDICDALAAMMIPGAKASDLYAKALEMATAAGMADYFMGHRSHAGFVGHGLGIEINEAPVIAPRSRDILTVGNVIALEPKFVIPGVGAIGIENTYIVESKGGRCITNARREPMQLD